VVPLKSVTKSCSRDIIPSNELNMAKPAEEGKLWEWRAFGRINDELAAKVRAYPIRLGIDDLRGEDLYLVSPLSDQNVKLRRYVKGWVLKFKLLLETEPGGFELYKESAEFTYRLPVTLDKVKAAAKLLAVELPEVDLTIEMFGEPDFVNALAGATPPAQETRVSKRRSQYQFDGGWIELAEVEFEKREVQSISVHSPHIEGVREMLESLQLGEELEPMNYIEACRRWG
jgi:hypothetical protein